MLSIKYMTLLSYIKARNDTQIFFVYSIKKCEIYRKKYLWHFIISIYHIYCTYFRRAVIWNPWSEFAKEIPDFGDDEFPNMVCVEAGRVAAPIVLLPGTAFEASQILQVP